MLPLYFRKQVYFAGDLFDHKHLIGNHILAEFLSEIKEGDDKKYDIILPQNLEQTVDRAIDVRDQDYRLLLEADLALFNFDGTDLDSGTVAEFMFAKMLDIPCVILRSDFRAAGDGLKDGEQWNLMLTGFPRSVVLYWHSMSNYQQYKKNNKASFINDLYGSLSEEIDRAFDEATRGPSIFFNKAEVTQAYTLATRILGDSFKKHLKVKWNLTDTTVEEALIGIAARKVDNKTYEFKDVGNR